jgi:hypothetical protein
VSTGMKRDEAWFAEYNVRRTRWTSAGNVSQVANADPPPAKYRNEKTDGFDSKKEAKRYRELLTLRDLGAISKLTIKPKFLIIPKQENERATHYIADFGYVENGQHVVEDCKGFKTDVYRLKRKLMLLVHKIVIKET